MNGFERRREQKKENIRQAALELFTSRGVENVTVEEIADKADVSPVTIFKYFSSKQNLVREIVKWMLANASQQHESILKSDQPYLARIQQVMFRKSEWLNISHHSMLKAVISRDPEIKEFVEFTFQEKQKRILFNFFEEGKRLGYINPDLSIETIMVYLEGLRGIAYTNPEFFSMVEHDRKLLRDFIRIIFFGLMGKEDLPEGFDNI